MIKEEVPEKVPEKVLEKDKPSRFKPLVKKPLGSGLQCRLGVPWNILGTCHTVTGQRMIYWKH